MWIKLRQKTGKPHTPLLFLTSEINFLIKKKKYVDAPQLPMVRVHTLLYILPQRQESEKSINHHPI